MRYPRQRGSTSNMVRVFIPDNSVTNGAGLTGLVFGSTNLAISHIRTLDSAGTQYTGANIETITTIGTYQAPSSSSKIRFKAVDATNFLGLYELHFHDSATAFGSGDTSDALEINILELSTTALHIGPNMALIPLVPWNYQDGVRMGLTGLANAVPGAAGGLFIAGTNAATTITTALTTTFTGNVTGSVASVTAGVNVAQWNGTNVAAPNVTGVPLVDIGYTKGTASAGAAGSVGIDWAQIVNKTNTVALTGTTVGTVTTVTNQLTGAAVATAIFQDATAGDFTVAGSIGKSLFTSGNAPGAAGGLFIAGTNAATTVTTAFTTTFAGNLTGSIGGYASGQDPATLVLGAASASWNTAATIGKAINSAGAAADPLSSAVPGSYGAGTAGYLIGTNLNATVNSRSTYAGGAVASVTGSVASVTGAVGSVTGAVGSVTGAVGSVAGNVAGSVASVTGAVGSVTGAVGSISGITFPTNFSATSIDASGRVLLQPTQAGLVVPTVTNLTNAPTSGDLTATMKTSVTTAATAATPTVTAGTVNDKSGYSLSSAGFDSIVIETSLNARQALTIIAASAAGVDTGLDTGSIVIKGAGVTTTRITATGDTNGNRSNITLSPPA